MSRFRHAFSLPKEEVIDSTPPGTAVLIDNELTRSATGHHEINEKHVHFQPEPSPDPADPLNFSFTRKLTILFLMAGYAFTANVSSSILSSALPSLVTAFAVFSPTGPPSDIVAFADLTQLIAVNNLFLGVANIWWVPLSNTFGRRPILITCTLLLLVFSIWCGEATSFHSLLAARLFQGCGGAAADTLAPDVVGRVFFIHQRGRAMAIYTIFLAGGSLVGGLIGGYITDSIGWRWTMYISAIMAGVLLVLIVLFVPETLFERSSSLSPAKLTPSDAAAEEKKSSAQHVEQNLDESQALPSGARQYQPFTFARSLGFMKPKAGLWRRFYTPYLALRFPGTLMVMLHYAGLVGLVVTISTIAPNLLTAPPYLWGANSGLINVGGLVGTAIGALYTYFTADWLTKRAADRESHGFAEPENRLPLMLPALLIATTGSLVFGFSAQYPSGSGWVGLQFGYGMVAFGLMGVPSIGFNYLIEAYGNWAPDCFLMVVTFRAIVSFAWTFFVGTWSSERGPAEPFGIFALLMGLFALTTIPVWLLGKRLRIATAPWVQRTEVG